METQRLKYLLQRHLAATTTNREQQELDELLQSATNEEAFTTVMAELMEKETPVDPANKEPWPNMIRAIVDTDKTPVRDNKTTTRRVMLYRLCAAAAVLLLIIVTVYEFIPRKPSAPLVQKIKPFNTISTLPGEQKEVTLPDGSHVWLNGASTLHYPDSFSHSARSVIVSGEAWFDVQHADKIPFLVTIHERDETTVQVVGTAFDIKAYPTQKTMIVSVQRGKVRVQQHSQLLATLEKGRQVRLTGSTVELRDIDTANVAAWKQGNLYYKDEMLADIVADLQRVFKDSIQIKNNSLKEIVTTAAFNKNIGIQNALHILCRITDARLSKKNGIYVIE
jgi:ferric-dicitrate binding protein FerR (iron transport regulator)